MTERERRILENSRRSHKHTKSEKVSIETILIAGAIGIFIGFNCGRVYEQLQPKKSVEMTLTDEERTSQEMYEKILNNQAREKSYEESVIFKEQEREKSHEEVNKMDDYQHQYEQQKIEEFQRHQDDIRHGRGEL